MKSYQSRFYALVADDEPMMRQAVTAAVPLLAAVALMSLLTDMFAVFPHFSSIFSPIRSFTPKSAACVFRKLPIYKGLMWSR